MIFLAVKFASIGCLPFQHEYILISFMDSQDGNINTSVCVLHISATNTVTFPNRGMASPFPTAIKRYIERFCKMLFYPDMLGLLFRPHQTLSTHKIEKFPPLLNYRIFTP